MRLDVIYQESKGILTHAERDFYLAYCSFADNDTGQCHPKMKTVAERVGIPAQSASRMYKKIIGYGFLERVPNGHRCLIGYDKSKHTVNFSPPKSEVKSKPLVNKSSLPDNSSSQQVNLHIKEGTSHLTTQSTKKKCKTKEPDSPELIAFRKVLSDYQNSYAKPTTKRQSIANAIAIRALFGLADGNTEVCLNLHKKLQKETFRRGRVDWTTVHRDFNFDKVNNGTSNKTANANQGNDGETSPEFYATIGVHKPDIA